MSSLLTLLASAFQATEPGPPGLELAGPSAILGRLYTGKLQAEQVATLDAALRRCAAGDMAALEQLIALSGAMQVGNAAEVANAIAGLEDLLALRAALQSGGSLGVRARLSRPASFALLRSLTFPPVEGRPGVALIGLLDDGVTLNAPPPTGKHLLLKHIGVAYDGVEPGPLLTITNIPSNGRFVPSAQERRNWRQSADEQADVQAFQGDRKLILVTRSLVSPTSIVSQGLQIDIAPEGLIGLYETTFCDEGRRLLFTYIRAFPAI